MAKLKSANHSNTDSDSFEVLNLTGTNYSFGANLHFGQ